MRHKLAFLFFIFNLAMTRAQDAYGDLPLFANMAVDGGISSITSPSPSGCYTSSQSVVVVIQNFGTSAISNVPVTIVVSGPINQTISSNYVPSIAVGASANFMAGTVNMSMGGVYTFSAYTTIPGDANPNNDLSIATRTVSPNVSISGQSYACIGSTVTLSGNGANTYTWSNAATGGSIAVSPNATTVYSVIGTATTGCTAVAFITVNIQTPTITASGTSGCGNPVNGTLTANAFSPSTISWYASPTSTTVLGTGSAYPVSSGSSVTYYAEAQTSFPGSLFTTMAGGNSFAGNMFDVIALNTLTINGLDWHFNSNTTSTVEIWYRSGTFVGFETSNAGWTLAHSTTLVPLGTGSLTPIPGTFAIVVPANLQYGIYVTVNGGSGINYTNGTALGNLFASNADIQFYEGKGGAYFNVVNSPRIFNGVIHYAKDGCTSPRVPATFSVVPGVTVTAATNATSICQGASASFTAFGAENYSWSPAADVSPANGTIVAASPTANTIYTVTGSIPSCTQIGSFTLGLVINPSPNLSITPSQTVAPGSIVTLTCGGASIYSWTPGGSNNNFILVTPSVTTVYTVTGYNTFNCSSIITTTVTIGTIGLNKYEKDGVIKIFPNPSSGKMVFMLQDHYPAKLKIYDLNGKLVTETGIEKKDQAIDIQLLDKGMYFYRITCEDNCVFEGKLIKD